jgi:hypothetical protein
MSELSKDAVYQALAARRAQWDNLFWQVPVLSFTAQAFLFTIALGPGTTVLGRTISASLSVLISFLSLTLMKGHRRSEIADAVVLQGFEEATEDPTLNVHGVAFKERRLKTSTKARGLDIYVPKLPGYVTWVWGLTLLGLAGLAIVYVSLFHPELLGTGI